MSAKHNITWFDKVPYEYDDSMKKLTQTIKDFERNTININAAPDHTNNS